MPSIACCSWLMLPSARTLVAQMSSAQCEGIHFRCDQQIVLRNRTKNDLHRPSRYADSNDTSNLSASTCWSRSA